MPKIEQSSKYFSVIYIMYILYVYGTKNKATFVKRCSRDCVVVLNVNASRWGQKSKTEVILLKYLSFVIVILTWPSLKWASPIDAYSTEHILLWHTKTNKDKEGTNQNQNHNNNTTLLPLVKDVCVHINEVNVRKVKTAIQSCL